MTVFANDPELLARFRAGDHDALSRVYWFYVARVESVIRRGLQFAQRESSRPRLDVADLVQEVFSRAFAQSARQAYDGTREYGPLLWTITRNALVDCLRRSGREELASQEDLEELLDSAGFEQGQEAPWADAETIALVKRYLAGLPQPEYGVYVQRYREGLSQVQAAAALGLTRQQVRTLDARVHAGLVKELTKAAALRGSQADVAPTPKPSSVLLAKATGKGE